jgi:methionine-rich copper-binding protein CopC
VNRRLVARVAAALLLASATAVHAHSLLLEASPAPDTTVPPPREVRLRFNNRVERSLSRVRVVDARGAVQDLPVAKDGGADSVVATAPALAAGAYRLEWRVLSADGHVVTGRYAFRVAP